MLGRAAPGRGWCGRSPTRAGVEWTHPNDCDFAILDSGDHDPVPTDGGNSSPSSTREVRPRGRVWMGRHDGRPELRSRSRRVARALSWVLAAAVGTVLVIWGWNGWRLLDPCRRIAPPGTACVPPGPFLPVLQFAITVTGIAAGVAVMAYLVHLGSSGRTWRRWRGVAWAFGALVVAWTLVFAVGALTL